MPPVELLGEAERMMRICNACRYCEGFCAVFPALERRRVFEDCDLIYLANLCHDCRDCYYACQYAPPHEFDLNIPKIFQELRVATYKDFVWPGFFAGLFQRNGLAVTLITVVVTLMVIMTVSFQGVSAASGIGASDTRQCGSAVAGRGHQWSRSAADRGRPQDDPPW